MGAVTAVIQYTCIQRIRAGRREPLINPLCVLSVFARRNIFHEAITAMLLAIRKQILPIVDAILAYANIYVNKKLALSNIK